MKVLKWTLIAYLLAVGYVGLVTSSGSLWYKVYISQARIGLLSSKQDTGNKEAPSNLTAPYMPCSIPCSLKPWCQIFCYDPTSSFCHFYDMVVKPGYQESNMADALICYTKRSNDYAVGAFIDGTPYDPVHTTKLISNLVDGIYGYKLSECYKSIYEVNPWFYVDLRAPITIKSVTLVMQPSVAAKFMYDFEVRVHPDGAAPTDPAIGEFFGEFKDPALADEWFVMEKKSSISVRYVTVQRFTDAKCNLDPVPGYADCCIQMCHVEIH